MTSLVLLFWIALAIVLQLAIYLGIGFWCHWVEYKALRSGAAALSLPLVPPVPAAPDEKSGVAAWAGFRTFRVERKEVEDVVQSICSFYLVPEDGLALPSYLPGQFLIFRLDIPGVSGAVEQITRCYSLSDAPRSDGWRISVKRMAQPAGSHLAPGRSSTYFHDQVTVGSRLQVRAPAGHFHLERSAAPVVLIGGGIGITPMLSMLNWCLTEQPGREIWLFYGVRNHRELIMKAQLEALAAAHPNFHLRFCFSDPLSEETAGRDYQHGGRIDVTLLRAQLPLKPYNFYICGPSPMMECLVQALEDWGVPESRVHFEAFGPASIRRKKSATTVPVAGAVPDPARNTVEAAVETAAGGVVEAAPGSIVVTFASSGKQLPWQPGAGSLLDFAEANGVSVDSGCRAGGCGTCQTTIKSGEVAYRQTPDYDPEPGTCLLCVCTPKTSVTLEI